MREWSGACTAAGMIAKVARLFVIKNKFEAFLVIYGIATGAIERGVHYLQQYPGTQGYMLLALSPVIVFMAGARILDSVDREWAER